MFWYVSAVVVAAFFAWLFSGSSTHRNVRLSSLERYYRTLVRMTPGSFLIADREQGAGFVQFAVVSGSDNWTELEFGLPRIDWSDAGFEEIARELKQAGYLPPAEPHDAEAFFRARFQGSDDVVVAAAAHVASIVIRVLGWDNPTFSVRFNGAYRRAAARGA